MNLKEKFNNAKWYVKGIIMALYLVLICLIATNDKLDKFSTPEIVLKIIGLFTVVILLSYYNYEKKLQEKELWKSALGLSIFTFTYLLVLIPFVNMTTRKFSILVPMSIVIGIVISFLVKKMKKKQNL